MIWWTPLQVYYACAGPSEPFKHPCPASRFQSVCRPPSGCRVHLPYGLSWTSTQWALRPLCCQAGFSLRNRCHSWPPNQSSCLHCNWLTGTCHHIWPRYSFENRNICRVHCWTRDKDLNIFNFHKDQSVSFSTAHVNSQLKHTFFFFLPHYNNRMWAPIF